MKKSILLVANEDEALSRRTRDSLPGEKYQIIVCSENHRLLEFIQSQGPDLVIAASSGDLCGDGLDIIQQVRRRNRKIPIILITSNSTEELAIAALKSRVNDYLKLPISSEELDASVRRCLYESFISHKPPKPETTASSVIDGERMIGESQPVRQIKGYIRNVAPTDSNVLITGETGTGKELAAELIHKNSTRHGKPFICVNSAAIPDSLLESEMFGYERGAFTGADSSNDGKLKIADGGTIFFDEIGDMSSYAQAKILRALETKRIYRLGGKSSIALNIRVIAATNQDLEAAVEDGRFRKDLYFRLNVARIHLPALRERKEDIALLLEHYLQELNCRYGREVEGFTEEALEKLLSYHWPGNVRELKNLLEAVFFNSLRHWVSLEDFPEQFRKRLKDGESVPQAELDRLLVALLATNWNKSLAAEKLQWSRMTVYRKMAKYRLLTSANKAKENDTTSSHPEPICNKTL
jgi:DNA-binding NtrC family response regulator